MSLDQFYHQFKAMDLDQKLDKTYFTWKKKIDKGLVLQCEGKFFLKLFKPPNRYLLEGETPEARKKAIIILCKLGQEEEEEKKEYILDSSDEEDIEMMAKKLKEDKKQKEVESEEDKKKREFEEAKRAAFAKPEPKQYGNRNQQGKYPSAKQNRVSNANQVQNQQNQNQNQNQNQSNHNNERQGSNTPRRANRQYPNDPFGVYRPGQTQAPPEHVSPSSLNEAPAQPLPQTQPQDQPNRKPRANYRNPSISTLQDPQETRQKRPYNPNKRPNNVNRTNSGIPGGNNSNGHNRNNYIQNQNQNPNPNGNQSTNSAPPNPNNKGRYPKKPRNQENPHNNSNFNNNNANKLPAQFTDVLYKQVPLTPEMRKILITMTNGDKTDDEFYADQELQLTQLLHAGSIINQPDTATKMNVAESLGLPFLQLFASNLPLDIRTSTTVNVNSHYIINIPGPIEIGFESIPASTPGGNDQKLQFQFFNTENVASTVIHRAVSSVLNNIAWSHWLTYTFTHIDSQTEFKLPALNEIAKELGTIVQVVSDEINEEEETRNLIIRFLQIGFTPEKETILDERMKHMFEQAKLCNCKKCGMIYVNGNCTECVLTRHSGKQIYIEGTRQMEVVEYDDDGEECTFVNYECCGVVRLDDPGCINIPNGKHENDSANIKYQMSRQTIPVFTSAN